MNDLDMILKIRKEYANIFTDAEINMRQNINTLVLYNMIVEPLNHYFMSNPSYKFIRVESLGTYSIFLGPDLVHHNSNGNLEYLWHFYTNEIVLRKLELLFN